LARALKEAVDTPAVGPTAVSATAEQLSEAASAALQPALSPQSTWGQPALFKIQVHESLELEKLNEYITHM
jgi:hypothetical protein